MAETPPGPVVGLLLAAGLARRMGEPKLLLPLGGRPVIRWSAEALLASGIAEAIVVAGRERAAIADALGGLPVRVVENAHPEAGQAGSIRVGIAALPPGAAAVLVALGDQPRVPPEIAPALMRALAGGAAIAAPVYREGQGLPVLFARRVFAELLALEGDRGARAVVARDPGRVALVPIDLAMPADVDTPEDYAAMRAAWPPGR
jgi:molybdenum cofactor cytidylyltransferase